jgi:glycosyltransferase involved in cell wall biosynthesis
MSQKIACVIPSYNHSRYVLEAIESVLRQTLPPDRLIIIDDGSSDDSVKRIRSISNEKIHLVQQENQGAHAALNRGLELAHNCDFIAVLNSDDRYHHARFAKCAAYLKQSPDIQLVCTRVRIINESGMPIGAKDGKQRSLDRIWAHLRKPENLVPTLGYGNFTKTTSNFFFRTGAIREFRPYRYAHDYFAALMLALQQTFGVIHEELLDYRIHSTNTIKAEGKGAVTREVIRMHLDLLRELRPRLETEPLLRKRLVDYLKVVLNNYTDMRSELLFLSLSRALDGDSDLTKDFASFPEVTEPSTPVPQNW